MATVDKDFRVKNGLVVALGGTFGSTVTVATPTENTHAATKLYVDTAIGTPTLPVSSTPPASPVNGNLWFDSLTERVHVYYGSQWIAVATLEDAETLQDHIHDTAIDGNGRIVTVFWDAEQYDDPQISTLSGGTPFSNSWAAVFDGGNPDSEFN